MNRLQELRGSYGIKAPAPICPEPAATSGPAALSQSDDGYVCQVVEAPSSAGSRLVPDIVRRPEDSGGAEIRLTYRELSALIEDAIRSLR